MNILILPNLISIFRIILVPVLLFLLINHHYLPSAFLVVISAISDVLDGYLARHYDQVTALGIILDPLADKLLVVLSLSYFAVIQGIPVWLLLSIIFRDLCLFSGMIALAINNREAIKSAAWVGKISVAVNLILLFFLCLSRGYSVLTTTIPVLIFLAYVMVIASFIFYSRRWFQLFWAVKT